MSTSKTIVLISGANQGVGLETIRQLTQDPTFHILLGCRSIVKGKEAASTLPQPTAVDPIQLDVTSDESIAAAVETVESSYGRLDVLVNNAGISMLAPPLEVSQRERFDKTFSTNVTGAVSLTDAFLPLLRKSSAPRIVFVSSEVGSLTQTLNPKASHYGAGGLAMPYKASKAAMNMAMATYAVVLRDEPFQINACTPGLTATNFSMGRGHDVAIGAEIVVKLVRGEVEGTGGFWGPWGGEGQIPW